MSAATDSKSEAILGQHFTIHLLMNRALRSSDYFQLFEYHWNALTTPKNKPILTLL
jgi:hypothetical protein